MTKYREILRLTALGLSLRDIEKSLKVSRKTVVKVQKRAEECHDFVSFIRSEAQYRAIF